MDLETRRLRAFLVVAQEGSLRRAARRLYVSQSSLSQQVAGLETQLGRPLFQRSSRGMDLTPSGQRLVPLARTIIDHSDRIGLELSTTRPATLAVGLDDAAAHGPHLVRTIGRLARDRGTPFSLRTGDGQQLAALVRDGSLACAVVTGSKPHDLTGHALPAQPVVALTRRDGRPARRDAGPPQDWADEALVTLGATSPLALASLHHLHLRGAVPAAVTHVTTAEQAALAVACGAGTALLPRASAESAAAAHGDELLVVELLGDPLLVPEWFVHTRPAGSPAADLVRDIAAGLT